MSHEISAAQDHGLFPAPVLRRSNRQRKSIKPRLAWQPNTHANYVGGDISIPQTFKDAINGPDKLKWEVAIREEPESLKEKKVFSPVIHIPHERRRIGSRWVFAVKSDGRFKTRLVAQGFSQIHGIDYFGTYSPTMRMDSLRIILAVSAFNDWGIEQIDIKTVYLEGDLHETVFMKSPEGMRTTKAVKLNWSLYGLKHLCKVWYEKLDAKLTLLGFIKSKSDDCIKINLHKRLVIGVYVDDLVICGKLIEDVVRLKEKLSSFFPIKDLGSIDVIIGWKITRQRSTIRVHIVNMVYYH
ncbi:hypothetical protein K3495_g13279 [Podosphaera aphanis]|nr:hypothetical protein K3495_g13279 [Podosphaera aphanis]